MFQFSSIGGKIDNIVNNMRGPYVFKINGQNHYRIGSLFPARGESPKFAQLYIYDTENECARSFLIVQAMPLGLMSQLLMD